jgi:hypothetical protein
MTYSTTNVENENHGSVDAVVATVDVTSLANAGNEPIDTDAAFGLEDATRYGVRVAGQEDATYHIVWDHLNDQLRVVNVADGTDVTAGTDVGEVVLEVIGT